MRTAPGGASRADERRRGGFTRATATRSNAGVTGAEDGGVVVERPGREARTDAARVGLAVARLGRLLEQTSSASGLSLAQYRVLAFVAERPLRASALAMRADVRRATLSAIVGGLERAGLVSRAPVEGDGRGVQLQLTASGWHLLVETEEALARRLADAGRESEVDLGVLARQIEQVIAGFERVDGTRSRPMDPAIVRGRDLQGDEVAKR